MVVLGSVAAQSSLAAVDFQKEFFGKMAGRTIDCSNGERSVGLLSVSKFETFTRNDFCSGGDFTTASRKGDWIVTECGDNASTRLIIMGDLRKLSDRLTNCPIKNGNIDWQDADDMVEALTYTNIGPAFPNADGKAAYLICCVR